MRLLEERAPTEDSAKENELSCSSSAAAKFTPFLLKIVDLPRASPLAAYLIIT